MIVAQSWTLLMKDKEIMWFPVLSVITSLIALAVFGIAFYFVALGGVSSNIQDSTNGTGINVLICIGLFVCYLMMYFITNFFLAGIYTITHGRFNGQDITFGDGINGAMENVAKIFWWSVISATVGVILKTIEDRLGFAGRIVAWLLGAAWAILTYFSLPSLIIGKTSVKDSFKQSASVIRKMWGETIIVSLGVGLFTTMLVFLALAVTIGVIILAPTLIVILSMGTLFILFVIVLTIISSALGAIFKLALYEYAMTGSVPEGFSPELIQNAVRRK